MAELTTLSKAPTSPFYYRVVELKGADDVMSYMPQRGLLTEDEKELWFNGVPTAAPTIELAVQWLNSLSIMDCTSSPGKTVYVLGISP
jgi:hypothetical protein